MNSQRGFLRLLDVLSRSIPGRWIGAPEIAGERLDPFLHILLRLRQSRQRQPLWQQTAAEARAAFKQDLQPLRAGFPVGKVEDFLIPAGSHQLSCRRYVPTPGTAGAGLMVYFHGGGFVIGDLDTHDDVCRLLCRSGGFQVISVDYRLAPEHPFPAALEDAGIAARWVLENAAQLGADVRQIAIGGDSAGANLATVTARSLAVDGNSLAAQLLLYPPTDYLSSRPSRDQFSEGLFLSTADRQWFYRHYLQGADPADARISPIFAEVPTGVAPAVVVTAALDVLRDEGADYAEKLARSDALAAHFEASGLGHGFANLVTVNRRSRRFVERAARIVAVQLAHQGSS